MGRFTDHVHRAVEQRYLDARAARDDGSSLRRDWRAWPVTVGLLLALAGSGAGMAALVRDIDASMRTMARESTAEHDRSAQAHQDIRAAQLRCEDTTARQVAELRVWLTEIIGADAELLLAVLVLDENQREAAQRLGLSHDAARKRFQRALGRLREHLASSLSHSDLAGRVCLPTNRMNRPEEPTA